MSKSVSEVRAATRQKQLLAEKVETQEYVANLLANARSHKRFKPIDVLGQGTCNSPTFIQIKIVIFRRFWFLFFKKMFLQLIE